MMRAFVISVAALGLLLGVAGAARAVSVAADGGHVWLAQPWDDDAGTLVGHRGPGDDPDVLGKVRDVSRTVAPGGVAAWGSRVYVVYTNGTLQRFEARRAGVEGQWRYTARPGPSLPRGVALRGFVVGHGGPWALVRAEDRRALRRLDSPGVDGPRRTGLSESQMLRNLQLGLPPNMRLPGDEVGADTDAATDTTEDAATTDEAAGAAEPTTDDEADAALADRDEPADGDEPAATDRGAGMDRLLQLRAGRWQVMTLPGDWGERFGDDRPVALVATPGVPLRIVVSADDGGLYVFGWQAEAQAWREQYYDVPVSGRWSAAAVDGHLVVAWQTAPRESDEPADVRTADEQAGASAADEGPDLRVEAAVLRHGRVRPIGALELPGRYLAWDVTGKSSALWLVGQHTRASRADGAEPLPEAPPLWGWTSLDLQGSVGATPEALRWREPVGIGGAADYYIMVGVLVSAVMLMLLFWRRDAAANQLALPDTVVLGAIGRRFMAAGLDLLPALLLVMTTYGLTLPELMMRWPGSGAATSWRAIEPGVLAVVLFVLYTTFAELLMQRTVGKVIFGLRVSDLRGRRPRVWQLVVRNALKSFDLVAWPLLILLVLGPYRQRLGDLVARTVVVTPAERDEDDADSQAKKDDEDERTNRKDDDQR